MNNLKKRVSESQLSQQDLMLADAASRQDIGETQALAACRPIKAEASRQPARKSCQTGNIHFGGLPPRGKGDSSRFTPATDRTASQLIRREQFAGQAGSAFAKQDIVDACVHPYNRLLKAIQPSDFRCIKPKLVRVRLEAGEVLSDVGDPVPHVFFPESCVASLLITMQSGGSAAVGLIGCEGLIGCPAVLGERRPLVRAVVQLPGDALRLPLRTISMALETCPSLRNLVQRYSLILQAHALQLAGCHALHSAQARLARFLLTFQNRAARNILMPFTQEVLAQMLGVQRTTITAGAEALQKAGLITYRRGCIAILDPVGLQKAACECYGVMEQHCESGLPLYGASSPLYR
jgi:CRP-like cAMP-binding protein